jgi:hypothetical protein
MLDLSKIPVVNGEIDQAALTRAIDELVAAKPYLKLDGAKPTPGMPAGPRGDGKPAMTEERLRELSRNGQTAEIERARKAGELDHLLKS